MDIKQRPKTAGAPEQQFVTYKDYMVKQEKPKQNKTKMSQKANLSDMKTTVNTTLRPMSSTAASHHETA